MSGELGSTAGEGPATAVANDTAHPVALAAFTATTFLSAMLLFSVQPLFAKMVLPILGGAPSVWAVALLFFQTALLAGYSYAHLVIARLPLRQTGLVHLAVTALALAFLPIALPDSWGEPPSDPYLWQLGLFATAIGLPFIAVSANAPLLQAWFAHSGHRQARDPYFLYAASNAGSLIALLSFPFVLEPVFGLTELALLWTGGFVLLIAALGLCFWTVRNRAPVAAEAAGSAGVEAVERAPGLMDHLAWVGLAAVPAALLTAFTTHVATDIASAPLIWVIPLSLYLLTFVVVFRERALVPVRLLLGLHVLSVVLALLQLSQVWHTKWGLTAALGLAAFILSCLVAHRTLYEQRPAARYLTSFYLSMSLGGALGGLFAALVAPKLFPEVFEYPLLLALSMACRPGALSGKGFAGSWGVWLIAVSGMALIFFMPIIGAWLGTDFRGWGAAAMVALVLALTAIVFWRQPSLQLSAALMMAATVILMHSSVHRGDAERSFFGVYRVVVSDDGMYKVLKHGTTLHGAQRFRDADGKPVDDTAPKTYYYPNSPMARAVAIAREAVAEQDRADGRFGIIGLGAGSLACLSKPGEHWRFYEIDPVVLKIARSPEFTYLAHCQPETDAVIGDARLTLAKEPDQSFDMLLVDAFSSDAVPMHLLTAEALGLYAAKLKPSGLGVLHISNRHLDLEAVLASTIPRVPGLKAFLLEDPLPDVSYDKIGSTIVVMSRDLELAHRFLRIRGARTLLYKDLRPWTDDASDILGPFLSKWRKDHPR